MWVTGASNASARNPDEGAQRPKSAGRVLGAVPFWIFEIARDMDVEGNF